MSSHTVRSQIRNLSFDSDRLRIQWADGHPSDYEAVWLRDNCPEDRDSRTGQRLVDIADLPEQPKIGAVSNHSESAILITWSGEPKSSWLALEWLRQHCCCDEHRQLQHRAPITWTENQAGELVWAQYQEVLSSARSRARWLRTIADYGIAFLHDVPCQDGQVVEIAGFMGYIRETNYGKVFDVRSVANPNNLAYSDRGLGVHTDNPYREPVPGVQILLCLQASGEGGESVFVDGFAVAERLRTERPEAFEVLSRVAAPFAFRDHTADLRANRCLLELGPGGRLEAVHYNNRSIAPLCLPPEKLIEFYGAYRVFAQLLRDRRFEFRVKLGNGDLVAFNNHRVLHGRTAFDSRTSDRWLQGCYVDWDGLLSNIRVLEREL